MRLLLGDISFYFCIERRVFFFCLVGDEERVDLQCPAVFKPANGCIWWYLRPTGRLAAFRVLTAVQRVRPDVVTCPQLQPLIAAILHFVSEEEKAFAIACALLREHDADRREFIDQTQLSVAITQRNFPFVARRKAVS